MSAKNRKPEKKIRSLERALRKGRLPRNMNLIHWLEDHGHAQTAGAARKLIEEDRVMSESHPLGKRLVTLGYPKTKQHPDGGDQIKVTIIDPIVSAAHRTVLYVKPPKEDDSPSNE